MKNTTIKGLVHAGLTIGALIEALTTTSKFRKLLSGAAAGYHTHATMYHLLYEKEPEQGPKCKCGYWAALELLPDNVGEFHYYCRGCDSWYEGGTHGIDEEDYEEEFWDT